jgi:acetyltransferase-like isoleucine patch superfamily enzyme
MRYIVLKGRESTIGSLNCEYSIFDIIEIDYTKDQEEQLRKYSYRKFHELGAKARTMRKEVSHNKKNITLGDGSMFAEEIDMFQHTHTYFLFVPATNFVV